MLTCSCRWPIFTIRCSQMLGRETLHEVWRQVAWSCNVAFAGFWPNTDVDGKRLPDAFLPGKRLSLQAAVTVWRSDWKALKESFHLSNSYNSTNICHLCGATRTAGPMSYADLRPESAWQASFKSTGQFIEEVCPAEGDLPCFSSVP